MHRGHNDIVQDMTAAFRSSYVCSSLHAEKGTNLSSYKDQPERMSEACMRAKSRSLPLLHVNTLYRLESAIRTLVSHSTMLGFGYSNWKHQSTFLLALQTANFERLRYTACAMYS